MLLQAHQISYHLGAQCILDDVTFQIGSNTITSIIGYNGSGKSTLLKILLGTITPTYGSISRAPGLIVGYVPQKLTFDHHVPLTVRDFLVIYNGSSYEQLQLPCSILDIKSLYDRPMYGLSGGQLQKVLLYNALVGQPGLILLDEPTAGLDITAQKEFYDLIDHIHTHHDTSIILVSHDLHTVYSKSDTIICLDQGICCMGCPGDKQFHSELKNYLTPYLHTPA